MAEYETQLKFVLERWIDRYPEDSTLVIPTDEALEMQELLNVSVAHVRKQGRAAVMEGAVCAYRTGDGLGCGAAPFIMEYDPRMDGPDGGPFFVVLENFLEKIDPIAAKHRNFVTCVLQQAHDSPACSGPAQDFLEMYERVLSDKLIGWNEAHGYAGLYIPSVQS